MTEFNLRVVHTTNDVHPVLTKPLGMATPWSRNHWIQSLHTYTFDHKANIYNKHMIITTTHTDVPCHTMQIILSVFYMHVSFTSLTLLAYLVQNFLKNARVHVQQV
jgi:hypothetical protein